MPCNQQYALLQKEKKEKKHRAWLSLEQALQSVIQSTDQEGTSRQHDWQSGRKKEYRT